MNSLDKKPLVIEQGLVVQLDKTIGELIEDLNQEVLDKKVDKVEGKGLSDNNFTNFDKLTVEQLQVVVPQDEAEAGVASGIRSWTAQRVRQAINAWWKLVSSGFGRNFIAASNEQAARNVLQLGTVATRNVGTDSGDVMEVGAFGLGSTRLPDSPVDGNNLPKITGFYGSPGGGNINYPPGFNSYSPFIVLAERDTARAGILQFSGNGMIFGGDTGADGHMPSSLHTVIHTGNILTTTGQSTNFPMTQKATTDAINGISDERDKTDINEIGLGLEVIENLKTFSFKLNKRDWYRQQVAKELTEVEEDGEVTIQEKINDDVLSAPLSDFEENDGSLKRDDVYTGFIAQDLKETLEALDLGHLGIVKNYAEEYEGGEDRFYIEHLALLPFLVNSIKQLSARVKELEDAAK